MQRSRRALLQRKASEKNITGRTRLYKVSLSLVFILWGLVFLSSLWISRIESYRDGPEEVSVGISTWDEPKLVHEQVSLSVDQNLSTETDSENCNDGLSASGAKTKRSGTLEGNHANHVSTFKEKFEAENPNIDATLDKDAPKSDRISRAVPLTLDEFKSKAFTSKIKSGKGHLGSIIHRLEPEGTLYNYASSSKGAKLLAFNKEAKGASNILSKDKDKYLRNPCSSEEKFVVIELSEETLVDTIEIANFEHYSSHVKDFELLGSLAYPTATWAKLGNFTAGNVKHAQKFVLQDPKWVRYLRLNLLSHYGSEFYCTLSVVEVYGVDAVERMLEDLISVQDQVFISQELTAEHKPMFSQPTSIEVDDLDLDKNYDNEMEIEYASEKINKNEISKLSLQVPDPVEEVRHQPSVRMPGDTVLKILMQKVRSLDLSLSVLERYLEDLNYRYGNIFNDFDKGFEDNDLLLEKIRLDIKNFLDSNEVIAKDVDDLISWKSLVTVQLDTLVQDNVFLRSEIKKVQGKQIYMENKGIAIFLICLLYGLLALVRLLIDSLLGIYSAMRRCKTEESGKFCWTSSSWFYLLLNCVIIFVISL